MADNFDGLPKLELKNVYTTDTNVYAYQCPKCSTLHYPATSRCRKCKNRRYPEDEIELIWHKKGYQSWPKVPLGGPCTLLTWTRLWALGPGFDQKYLDLAIVQMENGLRALGHLEVEDPRAGMPLKAHTRKLRVLNGEDFHGLVFVKA